MVADKNHAIAPSGGARGEESLGTPRDIIKGTLNLQHPHLHPTTHANVLIGAVSASGAPAYRSRDIDASLHLI